MEKPLNNTYYFISHHQQNSDNMAKLRASNPRQGSSLKVAMAKLQRSLSLTKKLPDEFGFDDVPHDVKEGHFAVMAMDGQNRATRFVIPLTCLSHPVFLTFLAQAAEEYGFDRAGALTLPCRPHELERILSDQ